MRLATSLALLVVASCAHTTLYRDGQKVAEFQGDMTGTEYTMEENGAVTWKSSTVDHSSATEAQGRSAAGKVTAVGAAIAASGLTLLLK